MKLDFEYDLGGGLTWVSYGGICLSLWVFEVSFSYDSTQIVGFLLGMKPIYYVLCVFILFMFWYFLDEEVKLNNEKKANITSNY